MDGRINIQANREGAEAVKNLIKKKIDGCKWVLSNEGPENIKDKARRSKEVLEPFFNELVKGLG